MDKMYARELEYWSFLMKSLPNDNDQTWKSYAMFKIAAIGIELGVVSGFSDVDNRLWLQSDSDSDSPTESDRPQTIGAVSGWNRVAGTDRTDWMRPGECKHELVRGRNIEKTKILAGFPQISTSVKKLCACLNNAEMFCWYRNNRQCASPIPKQCPGAPETAAPPAPTAPTQPKYVPPYGQGQGGLNCVEIGYCSRATRSKTSTTIMVNGTATVITVTVGLPTGDTAPDPFAPPAPAADGISFTQLPAAGAVDSTPQMTPPPMVRKKERDVRKAKANERRWSGNGL
ncbi:hypothetical protein EG328_003933 [Venturia inaequalis]|uniref:Uncharacterized protein n=1 Tax=Venturia inaequalis TaxID=5025 RepID=A0A8H3YWB4_VENIN|nr:hypothetical protein EG328_003933 [Venturia inaequalis]